MSGRKRVNKVTVAVLHHCLHRRLHHHLYQAIASSLTSTSLSPSATPSLITSSPLGGPQTASFTSATCYHEGCSSEQLSTFSSSFLWGTCTIPLSFWSNSNLTHPFVWSGFLMSSSVRCQPGLTSPCV